MFYNSFVFESPLVGDPLKNNLYQQAFVRISIPIYNRSTVHNTISQNTILCKQLLNILNAGPDSLLCPPENNALFVMGFRYENI